LLAILFAGINLTFGNPRLPPGAIHIQPYGVVLFNFFLIDFLATPGCHLGLFTFNPYGVVLFNLFLIDFLATPGCHLGLFTFNPYGALAF
jgi:hypothetical protein